MKQYGIEDVFRSVSKTDKETLSFLEVCCGESHWRGPGARASLMRVLIAIKSSPLSSFLNLVRSITVSVVACFILLLPGYRSITLVIVVLLLTKYPPAKEGFFSMGNRLVKIYLGIVLRSL